MPKRLTVTIVIPVYNEVDSIGQCLDSIAAQTVRPDKVLVVDNNSTDGTVDVARMYPFVTVLHEKRQGVVYARNRGFDAVESDIIGRIDADSILAPDWVATVRRVFATTDAGAVTGSVDYHHMSCAGLASKIDAGFRHYLAWSLGRELAMQGANMALRTSVWQASRKLMCNRGGMHEDFDVSIHVREASFTTVFDPRIRVSVAFRQGGSSWAGFVRYVLLNTSTYAQHKRLRRVFMYPVIVLAIVLFPLIHMLFLGYDEQKDGFSLRTLLRADESSRVNPATYVE